MIAWLRWCHRWLGLIVLLQVLIWLITGFYFSVVGNAAMAGNGQRTAVMSPIAENLDPDSLRETLNHPDVQKINIEGVALRRVAGFLHVVVKSPSQQLIFDGETGKLWQTTVATARRIAEQSYTGEAPIAAVREKQGAFQVDFADQQNTTVVIDKQSGLVLKHVTSTSAVADWMFRLHFMDYSGGKDFNNLLIRAVGLITLWFALAGLILLGRNLIRGDLWSSRTLLSQLQQDGRPVKTVCGGGGTCGMCRVRFTQHAPKVSVAGKALLAETEIAQGIRLSCQQKALAKRHKEDVEILDKNTLRQLFQEQRRQRYQGGSNG